MLSGTANVGSSPLGRAFSAERTKSGRLDVPKQGCTHFPAQKFSRRGSLDSNIEACSSMGPVEAEQTPFAREADAHPLHLPAYIPSLLPAFQPSLGSKSSPGSRRYFLCFDHGSSVLEHCSGQKVTERIDLLRLPFYSQDIVLGIGSQIGQIY